MRMSKRIFIILMVLCLNTTIIDNKLINSYIPDIEKVYADSLENSKAEEDKESVSEINYEEIEEKIKKQQLDKPDFGLKKNPH